MSIYSDFRRILTLDCRESSQLVSESLDRPLRRAERIAVCLHAIGCWSCRRLARQVAFIRTAARQLDQREGERGGEAPQLSGDAKERMKAVLRAAGDECR